MMPELDEWEGFTIMPMVTIKTWANGYGRWHADIECRNECAWISDDTARGLAFVAIEGEIKARHQDDVLRGVERVHDPLGPGIQQGTEGRRWIFAECEE